MINRHEKHNRVYKDIIFQWQNTNIEESPENKDTNNFTSKYEILVQENKVK